MPDGSTFMATPVKEESQPKKAINPYLVASLPLKAENKGQLDLLLQQLQRIGKSVGVLAGAFAARLKDLSDVEALLEFDKNRKALEDALTFDIKYEQVKDKIYNTREVIKQRIYEINEEIGDKALSGSGGGNSSSASGGSKAKGKTAYFTSGQSSEKRIVALRKQRDNLQTLDKELVNEDTELQTTSEISKLGTIETKVDRVAKNLDDIPNFRTLGVDLSSGISKENNSKNEPGGNI